ncbi:MAG: flagellin [Rhabdaerophilum sp.]
MSVVFNAATAANVNILRTTNELFQTAQKRVATGKRIFSASDDATRFTMSQTMLSRSRSLDQVNNNISTALKTLESTDKTLTQMRNLVDQMKKLATDAQNAGTTPSIAATNTANIGSTSTVGGAGSNFRLSITSDAGKNFTYTFGANFATVTWGDIANALSAANIGVEINFNTSVPTAPRMELRSVDGKTGFTIDGASSTEVVDDMTGMTSGYEGAFNASHFVAGSAAVPAFGAATPFGMKFGVGGAVRTLAAINNTGVSSNSSITFVGSDGVARTWSTTATRPALSVAAEINAMNAGVKAEYVTGGLLQLRRTDGGQMIVLNGAQDFNSHNGTRRFNTVGGQPVVTGQPLLGSTNNDRRLELGQQYDAIKLELTSLITNNVVQAGRNLLQGQGTRIILNEFAANPIQIDGVMMSTTGNLNLTSNGSGWATDTTIALSVQEASAALTTINDVSAGFATYASLAKDRYEINRSFSSELKALGDDLVAADVAEESAKLTALQTQQQFAVQAFSAGSANAQSLLRLLG